MKQEPEDLQVAGICIAAVIDEWGEDNHFRAFLASESRFGLPLPEATTSVSHKGLWAAVTNLCRRLDKVPGQALPVGPIRWQIYLCGPQGMTPLISSGYIQVREVREISSYVAELMGPPFSLLLEDAAGAEQFVREGWLNAVEDGISQTGFRALANLARKMQRNQYARTIDSMVLDPLTSSFFLPAAFGDSSGSGHGRND